MRDRRRPVHIIFEGDPNGCAPALPYAKRKLRLLSDHTFKRLAWWAWRRQIGPYYIVLERQGFIERIFIRTGGVGDYEFAAIQFASLTNNVPLGIRYTWLKQSGGALSAPLLNAGNAGDYVAPAFLQTDTVAMRGPESTFYGYEGVAVVSSESPFGPRHISKLWASDTLIPVPTNAQMTALQHFDQTGVLTTGTITPLRNQVLGLFVRNWARYGDVYIAQSCLGNDGKFVVCSYDGARVGGVGGFQTIVTAGIPSWTAGLTLQQASGVPVQLYSSWRFSPHAMRAVAVRVFREAIPRFPGDTSPLLLPTTGIHEVQFTVTRDGFGAITAAAVASLRQIGFDDAGMAIDADFDYQTVGAIRTLNAAQFYGSETYTREWTYSRWGVNNVLVGADIVNPDGIIRSGTTEACRLLRVLEWRLITGGTLPEPYREETISSDPGPAGCVGLSESWEGGTGTPEENATYNANLASSASLSALKAAWVGGSTLTPDETAPYQAGVTTQLGHSRITRRSVVYAPAAPAPPGYTTGSFWRTHSEPPYTVTEYLTPLDAVYVPSAIAGEGDLNMAEDNTWPYWHITQNRYNAFSTVLLGLDLRADAFALLKTAQGVAPQFPAPAPRRRRQLGVRKILQKGSTVIHDSHVAPGEVTSNTVQRPSVIDTIEVPRTIPHDATRFPRSAFKALSSGFPVTFKISMVNVIDQLFPNPAPLSLANTFLQWRRHFTSLYADPNGNVSMWFRAQREARWTLDVIYWVKDGTPVVVTSHEAQLQAFRAGYSVTYANTNFESAGNAIWMIPFKPPPGSP